MKGKLDSVVIILIGISMVFVCGIILYERLLDSREQQILLQQIRNLAEQNIHSIEITPGRIKKRGILLTSDEIISVQALLRKADIDAVGGHNYRTYEYVLTMKGNGNVCMSFWGTIYGAYKKNKDALYLVGYQQEYSVRSYKEPRPVRVKDLGKLIVEKMPK